MVQGLSQIFERLSPRQLITHFPVSTFRKWSQSIDIKQAELKTEKMERIELGFLREGCRCGETVGLEQKWLNVSVYIIEVWGFTSWHQCSGFYMALIAPETDNWNLTLVNRNVSLAAARLEDMNLNLAPGHRYAALRVWGPSTIIYMMEFTFFRACEDEPWPLIYWFLLHSKYKFLFWCVAPTVFWVKVPDSAFSFSSVNLESVPNLDIVKVKPDFPLVFVRPALGPNANAIDIF